ncbi:MAG: NAD(P)-dependent glycerol-3-phosphate dehydrogenase [Coriobacteriales bacterium]|nr:NAD(P)-dependent glycerol-3-phosphate dehydrogenase [Coriobacteriales bacterium]
MKKVAIIGAGSFGSAIAHICMQNDCLVPIYAHSSEVASSLNSTVNNPKYLKNLNLDGIFATNSFEQALNDAQCVIFACPSKYLRSMCEACREYISKDTNVLILSKGLEHESLFNAIEVALDVLGNDQRFALLSGPNHAEELAKNQLACSVVASKSQNCARYFQQLLSNNNFRIYISDDVWGLSICASVKNIIAIANGILSQLALGDNASAALLTRGCAEMARLVKECGGKQSTCMGLAGMGDLIATCTSVHSRNRNLGIMLAQGKSYDDFFKKYGQVAEGAISAKTIYVLSKKMNVDMPLCESVYKILYEGLSAKSALSDLFSRDLKSEF